MEDWRIGRESEGNRKGRVTSVDEGKDRGVWVATRSHARECVEESVDEEPCVCREREKKRERLCVCVCVDEGKTGGVGGGEAP